MPIIALALLAVLLLSVRLNLLLQKRRVGAPRLQPPLGGRPGSAEWWNGLLAIVAFLGVGAGAALDLSGALDPAGPLDGVPWQVFGIVAWVLGAALATWAKQVMGASWRIGVDQGEELELVTGGPFSRVRNPIYTGLFLMFAGWALLVANVVMLAALAAIVTAEELLVRRVEEPYLRRTHGAVYETYGHTAGRFVPLLGRL